MDTINALSVRCGSCATPHRGIVSLAIAAIALSGCSRDDQVPMSYLVVNHTYHTVINVTANGEGGILGAGPRQHSGDACCVIVPRDWRPDLKVTIGWQDDSTLELDAKGQPVIREGIPVLIPGRRYSRAVGIPQYDRSQLGAFTIHFLPGNEVKAIVSTHRSGHPTHPVPDLDSDGLASEETVQ